MNVLDTGILTTLESLGGPEFVTEMLETGAAGIADQIAAIQRSAEVGDLEGVARAAHGLKSTAGAIGASRLLAAATTIEASAVGGTVDPGSAEIIGLTAEFEALKRRIAGATG
jgi:HPt (histidine-containing phosphotransfer) domain-containing protein